MIVIFDWDGTLCDSIQHIVDAMHDAAREHALVPPPAARVRDIVGLGLPEAMARLFPELEGTALTDIAQTYSRHFAAPERGPARLHDGAMDTLLALRARGVQLAVATGKSRRGLDRVLASLGLDGFFDATRCADETRSKPDPCMLFEILAERDKGVHEAVVIGDSEYDLDMAQQAGVRSIGVSFGVHDSHRLGAYQPLKIIDSLPQLLDIKEIYS